MPGYACRKLGEIVEVDRSAVLRLYEQAFNHQAFTGRSGGMFAFEGLGSVYWHMVAKLLLAVQEVFLKHRADTAVETQQQADPLGEQLASYYYRIRGGLGFNKSAQAYGAFPADPYSHTPAHAGAQQPGMTGQVKEEVLTRFGELGLQVIDGRARFNPQLLKPEEFLDHASSLCFVDIHGESQQIELPPGSLAFTWCQVPVVYHLVESGGGLKLTTRDGQTIEHESISLSRSATAEFLSRSGELLRVDVDVVRGRLL